jgi:hypothetical protein
MNYRDEEVFVNGQLKESQDTREIVRANGTGGRTPVVFIHGHSFGGLLTQIVAGRGLSAVSVVRIPR